MAVLEGEGAAGVRMLVWGWCLARCRWGRFGAHEVSRIPKGALFFHAAVVGGIWEETRRS